MKIDHSIIDYIYDALEQLNIDATVVSKSFNASKDDNSIKVKFIIKLENPFDKLKPSSIYQLYKNKYGSTYDIDYSTTGYDTTNKNYPIMLTFSNKSMEPIYKLRELTLTIYPTIIENRLKDECNFYCEFFSFSNANKNIIFLYDNINTPQPDIVKSRKFIYDNIPYIKELYLNKKDSIIEIKFQLIELLLVYDI